MVEDLTELDTFDEVIKLTSKNLKLPRNVVKHLEKWANSPHLLKKNIRSTFKRTFEMKPDNPLLSELRLGQRVGERTKLKKVKNLIIGWLAEEVALEVLRNNKYVETIEPSGIDIERTVEIKMTLTDPDYRIKLRNASLLFLEVASIGKIGDGIIRLKYNKVKRNLMKFFGLSKGRSVHWREHFFNPCAYLCVDLISDNMGKNFIIEGPDFYINQFPTPYEGWENQEVVVFDARKRLNLNELRNLDMRTLLKKMITDITGEFAVTNEAIKILGNPLSRAEEGGPAVKEFLRGIFELEHLLSIKRRRDEKEDKKIELMKKDLLEALENMPEQYQRKLSSLLTELDIKTPRRDISNMAE